MTAARMATCWPEMARTWVTPERLKRRLQVFWHEGPIAEDHPAHYGGLARPEAVAECDVGAAVYPADPTLLLPHRPDARRLDERADSFRRQVPSVIEAVVAHLGQGDLTFHHHPVPDADAQVAGEDFDATAAQNLSAVVPEVIHPEIGHVTETARLRRRGYAADQHDLPRLHGGQLRERVLGRAVKQRDRDARRREYGAEGDHQTPFDGYEIAPQERRHRDDETGRDEQRGEGRRDGADGDPNREQDRPQVQTYGRIEVQIRPIPPPKRWQRVRSSPGSPALSPVSPRAHRPT